MLISEFEGPSPISLADAGEVNYQRMGTFRQLLEAHNDPDGKLINVLDIPTRVSDPINAKALHSHLRACQTPTNGVPLVLQESFNRGHTGLTWGLAATRGTNHTWHIDAEGFATYINVVAGTKLWIIARPAERDILGDVKFFTEGFRVNRTRPAHCTVEAILLQSGDGLYVLRLFFFS